MSLLPLGGGWWTSVLRQANCLFLAWLGTWAVVSPVRGADELLAPASLRLLTNIAAIRELSPAEAARAHPVRVEAVISYFDAETALFVQDDTAGIWISGWQENPAFHSNLRVRVEGVSGPGSFAPILVASRIQPLGEGAEPKAVSTRLEDLLTGRFDGQYIELEGIVHGAQARNSILDLAIASGLGEIAAYVPDMTPADAQLPWLDARVRVRAVCGSSFNQRRQLVYAHLLIPDLKRIEILRPGLSDSFSRPVQPIRSLNAFSTREPEGHLAHVQGVVTLHLPGQMLAVQEGQDGLLVETTQADPLKLGDRISLVGFPTGGAYTPRLLHGRYRLQSSGQPLEPSFVSARAILENDMSRELIEARLVRLRARLLRVSEDHGGVILWLEAEGKTFKATHPRGDGFLEGLKALNPREGSLLELDGVCMVALDRWHLIESFTLLLRSSEEIHVLEAPPWWNARRAMGLSGALASAWRAGQGGCECCGGRSGRKPAPLVTRRPNCSNCSIASRPWSIA